MLASFYYWIRQHFGADAVVRVGKHGNLEWLPGKSVSRCRAAVIQKLRLVLCPFVPFIV